MIVKRYQMSRNQSLIYLLFIIYGVLIVASTSAVQSISSLFVNHWWKEFKNNQYYHQNNIHHHLNHNNNNNNNKNNPKNSTTRNLETKIRTSWKFLKRLMRLSSSASSSHSESSSSSLRPSLIPSSTSPILQEETAAKPLPDSVHLKLKDIRSDFSSHDEPLEGEKGEIEPEGDGEGEEAVHSPPASIILISEYRNVENQELLLAIYGWNKTKLELFSEHIYGMNYSHYPSTYLYLEIEIERNNTEEYQKYLELWKQSKFLTNKKTLEEDWKRDTALASSSSSSSSSSAKKAPMVETIMSQNLSKMQLINKDYETTVEHLRSFLHSNVTSIFNCSINEYYFQAQRSFDEQLAILKNFSLWFRQEFPYYYDGCMLCLNRQANQYFGSVYSNEVEREHHSGKTELYLCSQCQQISRFPRFNDMKQVVATKRGRCGEYSILMMLMLCTLGYNSRYVVDRDDHAWSEVFLDNQWIHIDPCEAAINEPFIYQHWGKNQTFILALDLQTVDIEDVTHHYTNQPDAIYVRRLEEGVNSTMFQSFLEKSKVSFQQLLNRKSPSSSK